jgi:type IV pilus assembly protein PilA
MKRTKRQKNKTNPKENEMLIKMKESKGFTLVELMIVVAIIGILAAVAVPFYQRYVQKAKLTSLVFPAIHSVETNIAAYYAVSNSLGGVSLSNMTRDADFSCISNVAWDTSTGLTVTVGNCTALQQLAGKTFIARPNTNSGKITKWSISGDLAAELGLTEN